MCKCRSQTKSSSWSVWVSRWKVSLRSLPGAPFAPLPLFLWSATLIKCHDQNGKKSDLVIKCVICLVRGSSEVPPESKKLPFMEWAMTFLLILHWLQFNQLPLLNSYIHWNAMESHFFYIISRHGSGCCAAVSVDHYFDSQLPPLFPQYHNNYYQLELTYGRSRISV